MVVSAFKLVAIEDFLRKTQRIPCGAGMVRGPSGFLPYPTSLSHTLSPVWQTLVTEFAYEVLYSLDNVYGGGHLKPR